MDVTEFFQIIKTPATVLHVLSVVLGMGSALASDFLFSFFSKDKKLNDTEIKTLSLLAKVVHYSLFIIIFSGILIFFSNTEKYLHSAKFLAKMSILLVLLINGYFLNKYVWPHLLNKNFFILKKEQSVRRLAFTCGAISVISWIYVCGLGVLDSISLSYSMIISLYLGIIFLGVVTAWKIEKKELD